MANDTIARNVLYLYEKRYPLEGKPQRQVVSTFPNKIVIGDTTRSDQQNVSEWVISDLTGGLGIENMIESEHIDRFWDSDGLWTMDRKGIYLAPLAQALGTASPTFPTGESITDIRNLGSGSGGVYVLTWNSGDDDYNVYRYNTGSTRWDKVLEHAQIESPDLRGTHGLLSYTIGGVSNVVAYLGTDGYAYSITGDASSWTVVTDCAFTPALFDTRLIRSDLEKIYSSLDGTTWDAGTPHGQTSMMVILTLRSPDTREELMVLIAPGSLSTFDFWTGTVTKVLDWGQMSFALMGWGALAYRDEVYVPVGGEMYKWSGNTVSSMGLDRDDGVADHNGLITKLAASGNSLCAITSSRLYCFNNKGWHVLFKSGGSITGTGMGFGAVSAGGTTVRLYFSDNPSWTSSSSPNIDVVKYMDLPTAGLTPLRITGFEYGATGTLYTPYFDGGFAEWTKTALSVTLTCSKMTATEYITVWYMADDETSWTEIEGDINANGSTEKTFPQTDAPPVGLAFRKIKFKLAFARRTAGTGFKTYTPILESFVLRYYRVPTVRYAWNCTLDLTKAFEGRTPAVMVADLETAIETQTLGAFATRPGETRYVKITNMVATEETGEGRAGTYRVTASEFG